MKDLGDSVLILGGAGFLGRGILRYMEHERTTPARVTVYSRDEAKHYALRARFPYVHTVLGDICDYDRLQAVMAGHDTVIHAAAVKYVPEAERDVTEAVRINVEGSRNVARAALAQGVKQVVAISTDKAVSPLNTYGATKMLMERIFQEAQRLAPPRLRFSCVRYGNVISSTGSVIPVFLDQIEKDGQVTITSPAMTRFWIPINDAVRLIMKALSDDTRRGHTYVYRCAAADIMEVATAAWRYSGRAGTPPNRLIGVRSGEKLSEELLSASEAAYAYEDAIDPAIIVVPPALSQRGEGTGVLTAYSSDMPASWLTADELVNQIREVEA